MSSTHHLKSALQGEALNGLQVNARDPLGLQPASQHHLPDHTILAGPGRKFNGQRIAQDGFSTNAELSRQPPAAWRLQAVPLLSVFAA